MLSKFQDALTHLKIVKILFLFISHFNIENTYIKLIVKCWTKEILYMWLHANTIQCSIIQISMDWRMLISQIQFNFHTYCVFLKYTEYFLQTSYPQSFDLKPASLPISITFSWKDSNNSLLTCSK